MIGHIEDVKQKAIMESKENTIMESKENMGIKEKGSVVATLAAMALASFCTCGADAAAYGPARLSVDGGWTVNVVSGDASATLAVDPPRRIAVYDERHDALPVFNPKKAGYARGLRLKGIRACECSVLFALDASSVEVHTISDGLVLKKDNDYRLDPRWGTLGWVDENAKKRFGVCFVCLFDKANRFRRAMCGREDCPEKRFAARCHAASAHTLQRGNASRECLCRCADRLAGTSELVPGD